MLIIFLNKTHKKADNMNKFTHVNIFSRIFIVQLENMISIHGWINGESINEKSSLQKNQYEILRYESRGIVWECKKVQSWQQLEQTFSKRFVWKSN